MLLLMALHLLGIVKLSVNWIIWKERKEDGGRQTRYVFVCKQSCFVHLYSESRRQLDCSVYVKDRMLSNCPQYSFRQADNEHRDSLKENIRNTFWWIQYYCPDKFSPWDRKLTERFPLKLYWEIFNLPRIHFLVMTNQLLLDLRKHHLSFISGRSKLCRLSGVYFCFQVYLCRFYWHGDTRPGNRSLNNSSN